MLLESKLFCQGANFTWHICKKRYFKVCTSVAKLESDCLIYKNLLSLEDRKLLQGL
jgi:hypothetical protein